VTTRPVAPQVVGANGHLGLRRILVTAVRRVPGTRRLASALVRRSAPAPEPVVEVKPPRPLRIRPGRYFPTGAARRLPIVVVVATGLRDGEAEELAREFEYAQMMTGSFRPLFVIDSGDFAPFRRRGYVVERVMNAQELASLNPRDAYGEYLFSRISTISRGYRAVSVVPYASGSLDVLRGPLLRLIGAVPPKMSREVLAGRAEAAGAGLGSASSDMRQLPAGIDRSPNRSDSYPNCSQLR
jgi:hypothetical protein